MKAVVQEFLERIIHKAMTLDAVELLKMRRGNQNPEMAVEARLRGAGMARMLGTFIDDLSKAGFNPVLQGGHHEGLP